MLVITLRAIIDGYVTPASALRNGYMSVPTVAHKFLCGGESSPFCITNVLLSITNIIQFEREVKLYLMTVRECVRVIEVV